MTSNQFKPSSNFFTDHSKAVIYLYIACFFCLSIHILFKSHGCPLSVHSVCHSTVVVTFVFGCYLVGKELVTSLFCCNIFWMFCTALVFPPAVWVWILNLYMNSCAFSYTILLECVALKLTNLCNRKRKYA